MSTDEDVQLHETTGPGTGVPSEAVPIIEALEDLPTVTREEIRSRYLRRGQNGLWADEFDGVPNHEIQKYRLSASEMQLPGFGEEYDDCGAKIPHVCEDCGHTFEVGRTCARSCCPRCGAAWVVKRAPGHVGRIQEAAKMMSANLDTAVYKHHVSLSPPPDFFIDSDDPLNDAFHAIRDIMSAINMQGVVYYHPYRGADAEGEDEGERLEDDRGEWKKRLFSGRNWEGDVREELEFSPHFHIVGACPWVPGGETTKAIWEETDWILKRITERNGSNRSLKNMKKVARAVTYCLSHTGLDTSGEANQAQYRAYGSAYHNAKFYTKTEKAAKQAVKWVASDTLGISSSTIECKKALPEDEVDLDPDLDDLEGDSESTDDEDSGMVKCGADPVDIDRAAEFVEDPEWQQTALHAEDAQTTLAEWREAGGWRGWVEGQTSFDDIDDDPPPD